jgi:putative protein kinase ArgK-like GTPase of G3E family
MFEVPVVAGGVGQQRAVRALRVAVDLSAHERQEVRPPVSQTLSDDGPGLGQVERPPQERRQLSKKVGAEQRVRDHR